MLHFSGQGANFRMCSCSQRFLSPLQLYLTVFTCEKVTSPLLWKRRRPQESTTAPLPKPVPPPPPQGRHLSLVAAVPLPPLVAAERGHLPALAPEVRRQTEAGRSMLEWAGFLPPEQVWEVQKKEEEEDLVAARDQRARQGRRWAVDRPALGPDLSAAL